MSKLTQSRELIQLITQNSSLILPLASNHLLGSVTQLKKFFELLDGQPSVAGNAAHGESIHRIVSRNRHDANTVRHDNVFALAHDAKAGLFQSAHRIEVIDAGNLRHVTPPPLPHGHPGL